jgi:hypothetical protein
VTGPCASGKTTFLDALVAAKEKVAPYGAGDSRWARLIPEGKRAAKVVLSWETDATERERLHLEEELVSTEAIIGDALAPPARYPKAITSLLGTLSDEPYGRVFYLHDTRQLPTPVSFGADESGRTHRLTSRNQKFVDVYPLLTLPELAQARARASQYLGSLFPDLEVKGVVLQSGTYEPMLASRGSGALRPFSTLSASERQATLIALHLARVEPARSRDPRRYARARLRRRRAVRLLRAMLSWGHDNQLILATASKSLASAVSASRLVGAVRVSVFHTSAFSFELPGEGWADHSMQRFLALDGETTFFLGRVPLKEQTVLEVLESLSAEAVSDNDFKQLGHREIEVGALDGHEVRLVVYEEGEGVYYRFPRRGLL